MEDFITFTGWVIIAFGILQIILFFKVWGMTNDVKEMKDLLVGTPDQWSLNKAILKGDKTRISDILFNEMFAKIKKYYDDTIPDHENTKKEIFANQMLELKKEYKNKYVKYGIDFPEAIDKIEKPEDIENL